MSRTFLRQDTQIRNSDLYDDTLAAGTTLETGQTSIEGDLNALRSQVKRAIWDDGAGDWFNDIPTINGKKRAIRDLNFDLDELEEQKTLRRVTLLTDVTVTGGQNWEILSVAGSEAPSEVAAVALTTDGAVAAQSAQSGGAFDAHELTEIAGPNAISPKNLCLVRLASTGESVQSSGREVFALLQLEATGVDGAAFDDSGAQGKLSFVRMNSTFDDLEAVPAADIGGLSINYAYVSRAKLDNLPEEAWLNGAGFVDYALSVQMTLDAAVDNQSGSVTQEGKNILWEIDDTFRLAFQDSTGAADILAIKPDAGGDEVEMNLAFLDVNNTQPADFADAVSADTAGTPIDIGVVAGVIATRSTSDLRVLGAGELYLDDGNQAGSTWAQTSGIKLSDDMAEWDAYEAAFGGEFSLLRGISVARRRDKVYAVVTSNTAADNDVGGVGGGTNLDAQLPSFVPGSFTVDYDVYLNGELLRPGADAAANHDYYPGTSLANGQLRFEFTVKTNDVLCVVPYFR